MTTRLPVHDELPTGSLSSKAGCVDLVGEVRDNCPSVPNQNQADTNHNGIGDACEAGQAVPASSPRLLLLLGIACGVWGAMTLSRAALRRAAT